MTESFQPPLTRGKGVVIISSKAGQEMYKCKSRACIIHLYNVNFD